MPVYNPPASGGGGGGGGGASASFSRPGVLAVEVGALPWPVPEAMTISGWIAAVGEAPVGAAILVDIKKNGVSVFSGATITIADGQTVSAVANADTTSFVAGDLITVEITQVGSTTPGANLGISAVA